MKMIFLCFSLVITGAAHADNNVPSGITCLKLARSLGMTTLDAYQTCTVREITRSCILKQQTENKALATDKKELSQLAKIAIKNCQN